MPLRVVFDLEDKDLSYFKTCMNRARSAAENAGEDDIISRAAEMIEQVSTPETPAFVQQRMEKLARLIEMLQDAEWPLAAGERRGLDRLCRSATGPGRDTRETGGGRFPRQASRRTDPGSGAGR